MVTTAKTLKIDGDSHFFPRTDFGDLSHVLPGMSQEAQEMIIRDTTVFTDPNARRGGFRASAAGQRLGATNPTARPSGAGGPVGHGIVEDRATLLPETGFDMQVLIPDGIFANPFGSPIARDWDPGLRLAICTAYNNATAASQQRFPEQFIGTAVVPFGDVGESVREATRAVKELGLKAITINGNWVGKNYDSIELYPFWKAVNDLNVPLYVHHNPFSCQVSDHVPTTYTIGWERMRRLHISNYLGFAFEYMVGMASLTLGGLLEEFPNLKFCFFEAGGSWLPWVMYTLDRVYNVEPQCARCSVPPSELIKKACYVSVEPDENPIVQAVAAIGSENFIIGSDYPHPPSTYPTTASGIERMEGLSDRAKDDILGGNLRRLFNLE
jgi:aminocarboxymuconate-semialdehyde decarboxylase